MTDANLVDVLDARDYLLEKLASLRFLKSFALDDELKKLTATRVFHYQEQLSRRLDDL